MDRETAERRAELTEEFYTEVYGELIESKGFAVYTEPGELEEYIRENRGRAGSDTLKRLKGILERLKEEPERPRHFSLTGNSSLLYLPTDDAIGLFEEVFHCLSRLDHYTEETYAPLATYTAALWAEQNNWIHEYSREELVEKASGAERVERFDGRYRGRKTSHEVLKFFTRGDDGDPLDFKEVKKVSVAIYEAILESDDDPQEVMKRALLDLGEG